MPAAAIRGLPVEGRLTICNLSIEMGAKIGMVAPDDTTFEYLKGRDYAPKGALWDQRRRRTGARSPPIPTPSSTASRRST